MDNTYAPLKKYLEGQGQTFNVDNLNALAKSKGFSNFQATDEQNRQLAGSLGQNIPATPTIQSTPSAITPESISTKAITIPTTQPQVVTTQPYNLADQIIQASKVDLSPVEKQAQDIQYRIANMLPDLQGEQQALSQAREQAGVNKFMTDLQGLNTEIQVKRKTHLAAQCFFGKMFSIVVANNVKPEPLKGAIA